MSHHIAAMIATAIGLGVSIGSILSWLLPICIGPTMALCAAVAVYQQIRADREAKP